MAFSGTGNAAPSMDSPEKNDGASVGVGAHPPAAGVFEEVSSVLASARATFSGFLDLLSLEARRAGFALIWMVVLGGVAAICIVGAWLGLMATLAMWAVSLGFPPITAVAAAAVINLVAGIVLIYAGVGMSRDLLFSATRRQLAGKFPVKSPVP